MRLPQTMKPRGLSFVSFLCLVAVCGAVWWTISYGSVYWDNVGIKTDLHEAANLCMKEKADSAIQTFVVKKLSSYKGLSVQVEDVTVDRAADDRYVTIDVHYSRTVHPLFVNGERVLEFSTHVGQDIAPVKW